MLRRFLVGVAGLSLAVACGDDGSGADDAAADTGDDDDDDDDDDDETGDDDDETGDDDDDDDETGGDDDDDIPDFEPMDCSGVCVDVRTESAQMQCYACNCWNAMDGWLPPVDVLQCSQAELVPTYTVDASGGAPELVPSDEDLDACANPSLLTDSCEASNRIGQYRDGERYVKWVCRSPEAGSDVYTDSGAIVHNARNGATCFFDDIDYVTGDDNWPDLDLMNAGPGNLAEYESRFYFTDGTHCANSCHDADPFIYDPFMGGIEWETGPFVFGPYWLVGLGEEPVEVEAMHLTSPEVAECRSCHRIGSAGSCEWFAPGAMGVEKTPGHEDAILDALDPASEDWGLAYWMPNPMPATIEVIADWTRTYGTARDRILECCEQPGISTDECQWEPLPLE